MNSVISHLIRPMAVMIGVAGIVGCNSQPVPTYPTTPPMDKPAPATEPVSTSAAIKVPPDAVEVSAGDYPPPAFPAPNQPGLLMVVDLNGDPNVAVASTAVTGMDAGKMMSITDVANMTVTMNKLHKYRIVFVPKTKMP